MQTKLPAAIAATTQGREAEAILRTCVHCGFCLATCPTYQILGDELDSPRGRIYLIKQMLEGATVTRKTLTHLDRCLTCRNCETTCPSGVQFGRLIDIGRRVAEEKVSRPPLERIQAGHSEQGSVRGPAIWCIALPCAHGRAFAAQDLGRKDSHCVSGFSLGKEGW